jgi:hypothetical protein
MSRPAFEHNLDMLTPRGPDAEMDAPRGEHVGSHREPTVLPEV